VVQGTTWPALHFFFNFFPHLKRRGYNDKVIESGLSKASEINRNNLRSTKKKGSTNGSPCFQLPSLFRKKMQASSVIIGKAE
jgi:hypothetical protein